MKSGRQKKIFQTLTSLKKQAAKVLRECQCFREALVTYRYRRVARKLYEEVQNYINNLMTNGSTSLI